MLLGGLSLNLNHLKIDFLKAPNFAKSTRMTLESPKVDICQNWPKRVLGDVISCLVSKFDKKFQWEVSQIAKKKFFITMLLGGLSVNLNHVKTTVKHNISF